MGFVLFSVQWCLETVQIQIETFEKVYRETWRVVSMPKPMLPRFVTISELFEDEKSIALRSDLLPDGREEFFYEQNSLLPAEGALIMTNYRLIFKGRPVHPASTWKEKTIRTDLSSISVANEYFIVRSFSISSVSREQKWSSQFRLETSNICLHNGIQLRSATFQVNDRDFSFFVSIDVLLLLQLIKVFFDEEVLTDDIEKLRTKLVENRSLESVFQTFCFSIYSDYNPVINKQKDNTLKDEHRFVQCQWTADRPSLLLENTVDTHEMFCERKV